MGDYALGGRSLGPGVTALSAGASDMSGWLLLGLPGAIHASGLQEAWLVVGLLAGAWLNWRFTAPRLRLASARWPDALSLPELLERMLGAGTERVTALRLLATAILLFFFTFYVAAGLVAGARLFEASFGLDYQLALLAGATLITAYTIAGGFLAVSWTDFFQACLMLLALIAVPLLLVPELGTLSATTITANLDLRGNLTFIGWLSLVAWGLGYFGQPHVLMRFMAIKDPALLDRARRIGMSWMLLATTGAICVGLGGRLVLGDDLAEPETVFITLTQLLFHPLVAGIVLAAILAAVMSTIDSQLLVASTSLAEDCYKPWLRPQAGNRELMWVGRAAAALVAVLAFSMALAPESRVLDLVGYAWAGLGASFGPALLLTLYWRGMTRQGALLAMAGGALTVLLWGRASGSLFDLYELLPGFIVSLLLGWLGSRYFSRAAAT